MLKEQTLITNALLEVTLVMAIAVKKDSLEPVMESLLPARMKIMNIQTVVLALPAAAELATQLITVATQTTAAAIHVIQARSVMGQTVVVYPVVTSVAVNVQSALQGTIVTQIMPVKIFLIAQNVIQIMATILRKMARIIGMTVLLPGIVAIVLV